MGRSAEPSFETTVDTREAKPRNLDRNGAIARLFQVRAIPTYVLIDHEGIVRETQSGWSPTVDGWLNSRVNKYFKIIAE